MKALIIAIMLSALTGCGSEATACKTAHWQSGLWLQTEPDSVQWTLIRDSDGRILGEVTHAEGSDFWYAWTGDGADFGHYDSWEHAKYAMEASWFITGNCKVVAR